MIAPNCRAAEVVPRKRLQLTMKIMNLLLVVLDPRGIEDHFQSIRHLLLMLTQQLLQIRAKGGKYQERFGVMHAVVKIGYAVDHG